MDRVTTGRHRGLFGTGITAWLIIFVSLFIPEWTRSGGKHCGVFFCCDDNYGSCYVTETDVVVHMIPWIMSGWLLSFVSICSAMCKCRDILPENVRQMAVMHVVSGTLVLSATTQFFVQKFSSENAELNFSGAGILSHIAGWMLFISGCCGYCHGYNYYPSNRIGNGVYPPPPQNQGYVNDGLYQGTVNRTLRARSPYRDMEPPGSSNQEMDPRDGFSANASSGKLSRIRNNFDNIARRFWRDY